MNMGVEIERVVQDLGRVTIEQILHEAIMNSIQANATNITITINYRNLGKDFPNHVKHMTITDNGDGFTEENTKSFGKYKTTHKQKMGAKGVGRFLFLKLFNNISIASLNKNIRFNTKDVVIEKTSSHNINTTINFSGVDQDIDLNLKSIENNIKEHFLPYFHLMKQKASVKIKLLANDEEVFNINSKDIPNFRTEIFNINKHEFTIDYVLGYYKKQKNNGFYCADGRVVIKNNKDDKKRLKSFIDVNILFLLSSKYFDSKVIDTRDDFAIHPKQKNSMFDELSWDDIQKKLSQKLKQILLDNNIDIEKKAKDELNSAIKKAPYLSAYLLDNSYAITSDRLIDNAKDLLNKDKQILRENTHKNQQEYKQKLSLVTSAELAEYIFDRQKIIDNLKKITDEKSLEKEIHNLFMEKNTTDKYLDYKSNNLWLFDDRFMVYNKVFSDKQIKNIFPELSKNLKKPDILSIISNTYNKDKITDIVIIELKKPDNKITPSGAEEQLLEYARYVNSTNIKNKIRIWTYAFLKFDNETVSKLNDKSYNKIPTHSTYSIYYQYHKAHNVIINFMDYTALADDANTRNKTFMNILNKK
jgi:hypothetical protein